ncbi:hypothetical protein V1512DRAFT_78294 [Lipomyces arxii]|uniref:uncharacterized protein n=1 Tax=Lipomyces arxii TaxID=56418 RepID=UPI0034CEA7BD
MATSLARQLSTIAAKAVTASTQDRKKKQKSHAVSLIYEPKVAATQDLDSIFLLALEGLRDLESIDHRFTVFEKSLFSETSISIDRYVRTAEQNVALDKAVESFLDLIAPRILLQPAVVALEWLVRRFKINELNSELMLLTFLPYYSHPIFSRILDIIAFPLPPLFSFLSNSKTVATSPPRTLLARALSRDAQLFALVSEHVVAKVNNRTEFHALLSFYTSSTISVILSLKEGRTSEEEIVERTLPHLSALISARKSPEAQTAAYMILVVLVSQCRLSSEVLDALSKSVALHWSNKSSKTGLAALTQIVQFSDLEDGYSSFPSDVWASLQKIKGLFEDMDQIKKKVAVDKFLVAYALSVIEYDQQNSEVAFKILGDPSLSAAQQSTLCEQFLSIASSNRLEVENRTHFAESLTAALENGVIKATVLDALESLKIDIDELELRLNTTIREKEADVLEESVMKVDSVSSVVTFEHRISTAKAPKHTSLLSPTATKEFEMLADIYVQGLAEKKPVLSLFIKNSNIFSAESDQAMTFLLRMWTSSFPVLARVAALEFWRTLVQNMSKDIDLQACVVYLIVALTDPSDKVRKASAECLQLLASRYESGSKSSRIWGLETIYGTGPETEQLKWLGYKDIQSLLVEHIGKRIQESVLDRDFVKNLIGNLVDSSVSLSRDKKKKDSAFKTAVLVFLCSHITGSPYFRVKLSILSTIVTAKKTPLSVFSLCTPLFGTWIKQRSSYLVSLTNEKLPVSVWERAIMLSVGSGDKEGALFLNNCMKADAYELSDAAGQRVVALFDNWKYDTQIAAVETLLELSLDDDVKFGSPDVLQSLALSTKIFERLLDESKLRTQQSLESYRPSKKMRHGSSSVRERVGAESSPNVHQQLKRLTLTLDLLERSKPERHVSLMKSLFTILGELLLLKTDKSLPVQYTQQILVDCMLPMIQNMTKEQLNSSSVRIDIIVSCIRSSTSPQIQNKFLLLVSALAKVSPELVLHSVMPIFTFMGANTVRQDDEFSAHVIQQTISQVIPALAQSTASESTDNFGTVELLLSFVDAFVHVPYHRRVKLFTTLIQTLGPNESLHLLLRLLGKRHYDATSKNRTSEAQGLEDFVDVFLRGFNVLERIEAARRFIIVLNEVPLDLSNAADGSTYTNDLQGLSQDKLLGFKIDLVQFIRVALSNTSFRSQVIDLFQSPADGISDFDVNDLQSSFAGAIENLLLIIDNAAAQGLERYRLETFDTLDAVLSLLPIQDFVTVLEKLVLRQGESLTVRRGLALIRSKFENDAKVTESVSKNSALMILPTICSAISNADASDTELIKLGLQAIDALASKFGAVEPDGFAGDVLDIVIGDRGLNSTEEDTIVSALVCLSTLAMALGARLLGILPRIVPAAMTILESSIINGQDLISIAIVTFFDSLIKRIPTFMTGYLSRLLSLVFLSGSVEAERTFSDIAAVNDACGVLLDDVIAKVQVKPILAALISNWDGVVSKWDYSMIKFYLNTMAQVIDKATRKAIVQDANRLFDFLLLAFDIRHAGRDMSTVEKVESDVIEISMKVILKLNDKVFRPLFVRTAKWATDDVVESDAHRQARYLVLFKFAEKLFRSLKSIVTSYYGYIVDTAADLLVGFVTGNVKFSLQLWTSVVGSLGAAFANDQEEFWQVPVRFDKIVGPLLAQLALGLRSGEVLQQAVVAFAVSCSSEDHYKTINKDVLNWMRSYDDDEDEDDEVMSDANSDDDEESRVLEPKRIANSARTNAGTTASDVKILAIKTLKAIYERLGEEWLSMLPQLVPIVAELLESDDETVETEVRKDLVPVIEGVLGESLDRYLD